MRHEGRADSRVKTILKGMTTARLATHHRVAVGLTVPLIASIGIDLVHRLTTGLGTFITDDTIAGPPYLGDLIPVLLGCGFLSLAVVLLRERPRFTELGRMPRACRRVVLAGTVLLGVGFLARAALEAVGVESSPFYDATGILASVGLALTMLAAVVLGLSQLRTNRLGWGGRLLMLMVPAGLVTAGAGLVDPDLASPVLITATLLSGLATVGAGADQPSRTSSPNTLVQTPPRR